jgi:mono/diheme cytochrome c family protein
MKILILISAVLWSGSIFAADQPVKIRKVAPAVTDASSGKEMFESYCAVCHGKDGKGGGPAVSALKSVPFDLTLLAKNNNGAFPVAKVQATLQDVNIPAHGSGEMPIWGRILTQVSNSDRAQTTLRISNIVSYIESLQEK